jgi:phosphoesterase RecJ-like protein
MYDAAESIRFLRSYGSFFVLGHKEPDGDCIASQLALAALLRALGKTVSVHSAGPFDRPEIADFADRFDTSVPAPAGRGQAAIIVDCSTPDRTGPIGKGVEKLPCLVIDHHTAGEPFGSVRFVQTAAPSSTMLVNQLFEDLGVSPDAETAQLLLFGLCTDTGFFRHLGAGSADTYRAVARLVDRGTSTADVYMMVYGRRELASRRLLAEMIGRTESHWGDRLLMAWQTMEDRERLSSRQRGEDDLYRLLQTVRGNVVVAFIKEEDRGKWSVGLRSSTAVDVGAIAGSFGGGGHRQAAGFDIAGTLDSVRKTLLDTLAPLLAKL